MAAFSNFISLILIGLFGIIYVDLIVPILVSDDKSLCGLTDQYTLELTLDCLIIFIIIGKWILFACCGYRFGFGKKVILCLLELILVFILSMIGIRTENLVLSGGLICIGSSGTYLTYETLSFQLKLASLGITLKERVSRMMYLSLD